MTWKPPLHQANQKMFRLLRITDRTKQLYLVNLKLHGPESFVNWRKKKKKSAEAALKGSLQPTIQHWQLFCQQAIPASVFISLSSSSPTCANTTHAVLAQEYLLYTQPLSYTHACAAQLHTKMPNFPNQESAMFWDLTCYFFPFYKQSPWWGFPPKALIVDDKRSALYSCHTAASMSKPGIYIPRAHLGLSCLILFLPAKKSQVWGGGVSIRPTYEIAGTSPAASNCKQPSSCHLSETIQQEVCKC